MTRTESILLHLCHLRQPINPLRTAFIHSFHRLLRPLNLHYRMFGTIVQYNFQVVVIYFTVEFPFLFKHSLRQMSLNQLLLCTFQLMPKFLYRMLTQNIQDASLIVGLVFRHIVLKCVGDNEIKVFADGL